MEWHALLLFFGHSCSMDMADVGNVSFNVNLGKNWQMFLATTILKYCYFE